MTRATSKANTAGVKVSPIQASATQKKHLELRVAKALREGKRAIWEARDDLSTSPPTVQRAAAQIARLQKIVDADSGKRRKQYDAAVKALEDNARRCEERILFASPDDALRLVQDFERGL